MRLSNQPPSTSGPERPQGWPIGSYDRYEVAQLAVDALTKEGDFPVDHVTIVGVNLMQVEKVTARLSWAKVLSGGAISGAWMGAFFGILVWLFTGSTAIVGPLLWGMLMGVGFGVISVAIPYAAMRGRRDFSSTTHIVAGRYDVLCLPESAERGREILRQYGWTTQHQGR